MKTTEITQTAYDRLSNRISEGEKIQVGRVIYTIKTWDREQVVMKATSNPMLDGHIVIYIWSEIDELFGHIIEDKS